MSDNRTNEPSHNRITIRAFRDGEVSIIHEDQVLGLACTLDELKRAVATYEARGALEAADRPAGTFTEAQVEAAAEAIHNLMQGDPSFKDSGRKREMRIYARAALVAAQGAARPVNGFDTTVERVKTGADSLHVAPQVPNQNETKSGNNFVSLDPEKVADVIGAAQVIRELGEDGRTSISFASGETIARALCEAYTEGKLTK